MSNVDNNHIINVGNLKSYHNRLKQYIDENLATYDADFIVSEQFGKYAAGATVPAEGKNVMEVINDAFCQDKQPQIIEMPSLSIEIRGNGIKKVGDTVEITYILTFDNSNRGRYSYGPFPTGVVPCVDTTGHVVYSVTGYSGELITSASLNPSVELKETITVEEGRKNFISASVNYDQGDIALTQFGNSSSPILRIPKGVATVETVAYTLNGVYPTYYGVIEKDASINEDIIIKFTSALEPTKESRYTYTTNKQHPVVAYPKNYGALTTITDLTNGYKHTWTQSVVDISGVSYYVYIGNDFSGTETFIFK